MPDGARISCDLTHKESFAFAGRDYVPAGGEHNALLLQEANGTLLGQEQLLADGRNYDASLLRHARVAFSGNTLSERPRQCASIPTNLSPLPDHRQFDEWAGPNR